MVRLERSSQVVSLRSVGGVRGAARESYDARAVQLADGDTPPEGAGYTIRQWCGLSYLVAPEPSIFSTNLDVNRVLPSWHVPC